MKQDDDFLWRQFCRLGEMMGDGLHHEAGGRWISCEYKRLSRILMPDVFAEMRKNKADAVDVQMDKLIKTVKCKKCGGDLRQSRKGSKVAYCNDCNTRYVGVKKKD